MHLAYGALSGARWYNLPTMTALERYRELRRDVNGLAGGLETLHCKHLACKPGCHQCCVNLTVFPVEFYAILEDLQRLSTGALKLDDQASCAFLKDGLCTIYAVRPMICRTHGLPVAFLNMDAEEPEMNVSFCPLNFTEADEDAMSFGPDSTLDLDDLNMKLYEANLQFLQEHPELGLGPSDRIDLRELAKRM